MLRAGLRRGLRRPSRPFTPELDEGSARTEASEGWIEPLSFDTPSHRWSSGWLLRMCNAMRFFMIFSKLGSYVLLVVLGCSLSVNAMDHASYRHYHHRNDDNSVVKAIAGVGLLAAIGYGVYKFFDWLFTKTDEQILQEGKKTLARAFDATKNGVELIQTAVGEIPVLPKEKHKLIKQVPEDFLYQSALSHLYSYNASLEKHSYEVDNALSMVKNRIASVKKKNLICPIISQLETLAIDLENMQIELHFCLDFLKEHAAYYQLFDVEAKQMGFYEFEINSVDYHINNPPYLREALRMGVMKKSAGKHNTYPYMVYVETIERDIKNLEQHINRLTFNYQNRIKGARLLLEKLNIIYGIVVSEDAYRQELRDYKKEMLERERIAAEKAKADAAAAQAHAAHMQAQAMQQQVYELHHQNQLQKQQNAILASQILS